MGADSGQRGRPITGNMAELFDGAILASGSGARSAAPMNHDAANSRESIFAMFRIFRGRWTLASGCEPRRQHSGASAVVQAACGVDPNASPPTGQETLQLVRGPA